MEIDSLTDEIHQLILRHYPTRPKALTPDMHFKWDLGGTSLHFVELIMGIEAALGIPLPNQEIGSLQTIGLFGALVPEKAPDGIPIGNILSHD